MHCIFVPLGVPSHAWLHGFDKYNVMYLSPESLHFIDLNPQGSRIRHSSLKLCLAFHVAKFAAKKVSPQSTIQLCILFFRIQN